MNMLQNPGGTPLTRREALGRVAGAGLGMMAALRTTAAAQGGGPVAFSAPPNPKFPMVPSWETELRELAPNVYAYIQGGGPGKNNVSVSNAFVVVGEENVFLVDSLTAPMHAKPMVEAIRKVTDKPFRYLINTHHHGDHINGNQFIPNSPEIISHPYCREEVLKAVAGPALWAKREGWADGTEPRRIMPATTTIDGKTVYHVGKTVVEVFPMVPAHTYGDLVVYLPQHRIFVAGDIGFFYVAPFCQNAHPSNWISVCEQIDKMAIDRIIPGHGPIGGKQQLAEMADYLRILKVEAKKRYDAKMTPGAAAADITLGKFDNWIGPERIIMDTVRFYMEFDGKLTPAVNVEGNRQATEEYNAIKTKKTA